MILSFKRWSKDEVRYLEETYLHKQSSEIAYELNRSKASVDRKMWRLGLRRQEPVTYSFVKREFDRVGWKLLSKEYVNSRVKLDYICNNGHKYHITWNKFKERKRCPKCYYDSNDFFNDIKRRCAVFGYTVLSKTYVDSKTPIHIKCEKGHTFSMSWNSLGQGCRCPVCFCAGGFSRPEKEIASIVRNLLGQTKVYENIRTIIPPYELDIFVPEKNLAIEYCGLYWHSEERGKDKYYHKNKYTMCKERGIDLITIFEDEYTSNKDLFFDRLKKRFNLSSTLEGDYDLIITTGSDCIKFLKRNSFILPDFMSRDVLIVLDKFQDIVGVISFVHNADVVSIYSIDEKIGVNVFNTSDVTKSAVRFLRDKFNPRYLIYFIDNRWECICAFKDVLIGDNHYVVSDINPSCFYTHKHIRVLEHSKLTSVCAANRIWDCGHKKYEIILGG